MHVEEIKRLANFDSIGCCGSYHHRLIYATISFMKPDLVSWQIHEMFNLHFRLSTTRSVFDKPDSELKAALAPPFCPSSSCGFGTGYLQLQLAEAH